MKKRLLLVVSLILCCSMFLVACGSSNGMKGTKWELSGGKSAGVEVDQKTLKTTLGGVITMDFTSDKKVEWSMGSTKEEYDYTYDEDKKTITLKNEQGQEISGKVASKKITLEMSGISIYFEKK